jgi:hypothetical protein
MFAEIFARVNNIIGVKVINTTVYRMVDMGFVFGLGIALIFKINSKNNSAPIYLNRLEILQIRIPKLDIAVHFLLSYSEMSCICDFIDRLSFYTALQYL